VRQWTVDAVLLDLFRVKKQSEERQRIYKHAVGILHQYFRGSTPLITEITESHLREFQVWYRDQFRLTHGRRKGQVPAKDSTVTWFTMIAAVFVHAHKRMKILRVLPLPEEFRGTFSDITREVLGQEDCLKLVALNDANLSVAKQVAKHCLILQLTTGIGLGDLRALTREHVKFDREAGAWYIAKSREKTDKVFRLFLTPRAKCSYDRLRELVGGTETVFNLTCTNNINGHYRDLVRKAGVNTKVTSYVLRHSFAVDFMDRGGTLEDLSEILGNDFRNTKKYGRISKRRLAEKTEKLVANSPMHQL
jgi:integrase